MAKITPEEISDSAIQFISNNTQTQIDNVINEKVERIEKLQNKSTESYEHNTDQTITIDGSVNGCISNVYIRGKTLVNYAIISSLSNQTITNGYYKEYAITNVLKENTDYTIIYVLSKVSGDTDKFTYGSIGLGASTYTKDLKNSSINIAGLNVVKITTPASSSLGERLWLRPVRSSAVGNLNFSVSYIMVLEGDYTNNVPEYFTGVRSLGDGRSLILCSCKNNLFNINSSINFKYDIMSATYDNERVGATGLTTKNYSSGYHGKGQRIKIKPNTRYYFGATITNKGFLIIHSDKKVNLKLLSNANSDVPVSTYFDSGNLTEICLTFDTNGTEDATPAIFHDIFFSEVDYYEPYHGYNSNVYCNFTNNVYDDSPFLCPVLKGAESVYDEIKKHDDGRYYYHQRLKQITLKGDSSENITVYNTLTNTISFKIDMGDESGSSIAVMCNTFATKMLDVSNDSAEFIRVITPGANPCLYIKIQKSKLATADVAGFKTWLQSNNTTIIYQLANEKVYRCSSLDLPTHEGTTNIIFKSNSISSNI